MSRIGRRPVAVPSGVTVGVANGVVSVQGQKGSLTYKINPYVAVVVNGSDVVVSAASQARQARANFGTVRSQINNMVKGVSQGWKRTLEMSGIGFTANLQGPKLKLTCGFSHDVFIDIPKEVKCSVEKQTIHLESPNREVLGLVAAKIRKVRQPEPYLGKGIKYAEEKIRRKEGKTKA